MAVLRKYCVVLSMFFGANHCLALVDDRAYGSGPAADSTVLDYADQVLECGVYYKYTAGGMSHNPDIAVELVDEVSHNSQTLLQSADWLYGAVGASARARYAAVMVRARRLVGESQANGEDMSELIFAFGKKCQRLVADYPERMREMVEKLSPP